MTLFQNEPSCKTFHVKISLLPVGLGIHFHMKGFARRIVLTQRQKATWKWPLGLKPFVVSFWRVEKSINLR